MAYNPNSRAQIVQILQSLDGCIRDEHGRSTTILASLLGRTMSGSGLSTLLGTMEAAGEVLRDVRGKRTYEICVGDPSPDTLARLAKLPPLKDREPEPEPEAVEESGQDLAEGYRDRMTAERVLTDEDQDKIHELLEPIPGLTADEVALSILRQVGELLALRDGAEERFSALQAQYEETVQRVRDELTEARERLSMTLDENQRLRQRARDAGDELRAKTTQIQGLFRERDALQRNLDQTLRANGAVVTHEVRKQIDQFMREKPAPKGD